ncbi:MAG TPA: ferritin-like domain-containing protein [Bryobacteraceae bacterium]|nr:ferritin-like domain-containing protein [Bryobacteraceae bacterium]
MSKHAADAEGKARAPRRDFLRGAAMIAGAAAAAGTAGAQTQAPSPANDLNILNYALTLELLEATFYTQGLARFSSADFMQGNFYTALRNASGVSGTPPPSGESDTGLVQDVYAYLSLIRNHEQAHVRTLISTIRSLGGTPVTAPRFQFPYNNVDEFIVLAATLENTGVAAYNGAIPMLSNPNLVTASATIATVEARHASYLNRIRGMVPFPNAFDAGQTMAEILQVASQFIVQ